METAFTNIRQNIKTNLLTSTKTIKIAVAWFTNQELFDILLDKLEKGVIIELIVIDDLINNGDFGLNFQSFVEKGGKLYFSNPDNPVHHKFCIIDGIILINGSYNWTYFAESRNHENIMVCNQANIIENFDNEFKKIKAILSLVQEWNKRSAIEDTYFKDYASYYLEDRFIKSLSENNNLIKTFIEKNFAEFFIHEGKIVNKQKEKKSLMTSIGIRAVVGGESGVFFKMLEKGKEIPCVESHTFGLHESNYNEITVSLYYGDEKYIKDCTLLVEYRMKIEQGHRPKDRIEVVFRVDQNGRLTLFAKDKCAPKNSLQYNYDIVSLLK